MQLVEPEVAGPHDSEEAAAYHPPRPERRRVAVSLIFTVVVLVATVASVFILFPPRETELMDSAIDWHGMAKWDLSQPSQDAFAGWQSAFGPKRAIELTPGTDILGLRTVFHDGIRVGIAALLRGDSRFTLVLSNDVRETDRYTVHSREGLHAFSRNLGNVRMIVVRRQNAKPWPLLFADE